MTAPQSPPTRQPGESWTVLELIRWTTQYFGARGIETPRLDAECLLAHALATSRMQLYLDFEKPVAPPEREGFRRLVLRRAGERIPVSQLVGVKEFWSLPLRVTNEVLTPRPDTETLVQAALDRFPDRDASLQVLDIGTGSGAIALAIASERPKAHIVATDISSEALQIASENADQLQLCESVELRLGSLFEAVEGMSFDLVVSNPPYLARGEQGTLAPELAHEPEAALFGGGDDGLDIVRPLVAQVGCALRPGGAFLVEIDPGQAETVASLCREAGLDGVEKIRDLAGRERIVAARAA